jgi:hypothetical protein
MLIPNEESFGLQWVVLEIDEPDNRHEVHIVPLNDSGEHEFVSACGCRPVQDDEDPEIWTHNSYDGREEFDSGERKLS